MTKEAAVNYIKHSIETMKYMDLSEELLLAYKIYYANNKKTIKNLSESIPYDEEKFIKWCISNFYSNDLLVLDVQLIELFVIFRDLNNTAYKHKVLYPNLKDYVKKYEGMLEVLESFIDDNDDNKEIKKTIDTICYLIKEQIKYYNNLHEERTKELENYYQYKYMDYDIMKYYFDK